MPVTDVINAVMSGIQIGLQTAQLYLIKWILLDNGWIYLGRAIGFRMDLRIVHYIDVFYTYFMKMLERDIFNKEVTDELVKNIYVFIGVIMVFRLMMLLMKYLINPDLTSDAKLGVNSLIRRVIIGCVGILLIPTIFDLSLELQSAIIKDNLIQKIVIPKDLLPRIVKVQQRGGKYIATFIQAGFVTPSESAPDRVKKLYDTGIKNGDLSVLKGEMTKGIFGNVDNYTLNYVPIVSTLVLAYVLMQMAKYCIDLATRCLRLLLYKLLTPVAMIEYMIKGADDGVFKKWKSAIISTYVSLFIRVMAMWFVIFVTALMQFDPNDKYISNSLLDNPDDTLLRAIIIVALIGFMMDLPKMVGSIFDLDLEQAGAADGLFKTITGLVKTGYMGGLGLAAMGISGITSAAFTGGKALAARHDNSLTDAQKDKWKQDHAGLNNAIGFLNDNPFAQGIGAQRAATTKGLAGLSPFTKSIYEGASGIWGATTGAYDKKESGNKEKDKAKAAEARDIEREAREKRQEMREELRDIRHDLERGADIGRFTKVEADGSTRPMTLSEIKNELKSDYTSGIPTVMAGLNTALGTMMGKGDAIDVKSLASELSVQLSNVGINLSGTEATNLAEKVMDQAFPGVPRPRSGVYDLNATTAANIVTNFASAYETRVDKIIENRLGINNAGYVAGSGYAPDVSVINTPGKTTMVHGINNEPLDVMHQQLDVQQDINFKTGQIQQDARAIKHINRNQVSIIDDIDEKLGNIVDPNGNVTLNAGNFEFNVAGEANAKFNGKVNVDYQRDVTNRISGSVNTKIEKDVNTVVNENMNTMVKENANTVISGNDNTFVEKDSNVVVSGNSSTYTAGDNNSTVEGDAHTKVLGTTNIDAGNVTVKADTINENADTINANAKNVNAKADTVDAKAKKVNTKIGKD